MLLLAYIPQESSHGAAIGPLPNNGSQYPDPHNKKQSRRWWQARTTWRKAFLWCNNKTNHSWPLALPSLLISLFALESFSRFIITARLAHQLTEVSKRYRAMGAQLWGFNHLEVAAKGGLRKVLDIVWRLFRFNDFFIPLFSFCTPGHSYF